MTVWICAFLFILFASCNKESQFIPVYDVPQEFQPLIDTFVIEASKRGLQIELSNLIIKYDENLDAGICGRCNSLGSTTEVQKEIIFNSKFKCWDLHWNLKPLFFMNLDIVF